MIRKGHGRMVDSYRLRGPLDHLGLSTDAPDIAAVALSEIRFSGLINVRGDAADDRFLTAVKKATRLDLPVTPNTVAGKPTGTRIMWLGPDEWLVVTRPGGGTRMAASLSKALKVKDLHAAVTEVSDSRTCFKLSGQSARSVLAKGCSVDIHPGVFEAGHCAQTVLARVNVLMTQSATARNGAPTFEIYVLRSFAAHLWAWLQNAAEEFQNDDG